MSGIRKSGWWYPYIFLGAFVVVVAVNGTMAYFATSTFSGLATNDAYEKGNAYNHNLAMARAQLALGWTVETTFTPRAGGAEVAVTCRDKDGKPLDGLAVHAMVMRPTVRGMDQTVTLVAGGQGVYGASVGLPQSGEWDADIVAVADDGKSFEVQRRFLLP